MSPETVGHADIKAAVYTALLSSIRQRRLPCHVLPDGVTVRIDNETAYEPDAQVYCGEKLTSTALEVPKPVIIVEVLSTSTRRVDLSQKLAGYFRLPSVRALPHLSIRRSPSSFIIPVVLTPSSHASSPKAASRSIRPASSSISQIFTRAFERLTRNTSSTSCSETGSSIVAALLDDDARPADRRRQRGRKTAHQALPAHRMARTADADRAPFRSGIAQQGA